MENICNKQAQQCAEEIMQWLEKHNLTFDTYIYVNNNRYSYWSDKTWHMETEEDPRDHFDFVGDFLSMSFEGGLYDIINYNYSVKYCDDILEEFKAILAKYGKYYELGNAWNLSLYDI